MKYLFLLYFIPFSISLYCSDLIKINGIKKSIYYNTFDTTLFTLSKTTNYLDIEDIINFQMTLSLTPNISLNIIRLDQRNINELEMLFPLSKLISLSLISIFSEDKNYDYQYINHALNLKTNGEISFGTALIFNFSEFYKTGYKVVFFNKIDLPYIKSETIFDVKKEYKTPFNRKQPNGWRIKNHLIISPINFLQIIPTVYYSQLDKTILLNRSLSISYIGTTLKLTIRYEEKDKTEKSVLQKHYLGEILLKQKLFNLENEVSLNPNYINTLFYKGYCKSRLKLTSEYSVNIKWNWDYIRVIRDDICIGIEIDKKSWIFTLIYSNPLHDNTTSWQVTGSITQKI